VGLLHSKLKEFLDLEQGKHTVFNYTRQFNTLAEYGSHHVDTDEKKAILFHKGLTIQLQDRLVQSPNLSYNYLASAAIDQERTMKAVVETEEIHVGVHEEMEDKICHFYYRLLTEIQDIIDTVNHFF
jgi:hypothetical protein